MTQRTGIGERLARGDPAMLSQLFHVLADAVTVRDLTGELVFANQAALARLGCESLQDLRSRSTAAMMEEYLTEDERGNPIGHGDIPSVRLIRGEPVSPLLLRTVNHSTGAVSWSLLKASPLREADGTLAGAITVIQDMTAVKAAEVQMRVLAESGRILASSLDYQQTLLNVTRVAVPALADFCGVDLLDEAGQLIRVAATQSAAANQDPAEQLRDLRPTQLDGDHPITGVLQTSTSVLYPQITDQELSQVARSDAHLQPLHALDVRSLMIVPMRVPTSTIGVMTLATVRSGRRFEPADVELAEQLARRAAVAVDNSRLLRKLMDVAETVQQSLLPTALPPIPSWEIASMYRPAGTELRIDVGGDFFEFFEHEGTWFLIFGDVAGKGVSAASMTALMRHGARVASRSQAQPASILARLDEALATHPGDKLCTALCLCIHPDHLVISSAGHPAAILVAPDGSLREAPRSGPLLGAFPDSTRPEEEIKVGRDELLVLYTDGVTEAQGRHGRFGVDRLRALLAAHAGAPPQRVLDALEAELEAFSGAAQRDDVLALALRTRGE